jgi:hypothetical protein
MLGGEIIGPAEIFRFFERDQIIYDRQEQISMNGMISYGYMVLHGMRTFLKRISRQRKFFTDMFDTIMIFRLRL